MEDSEKSKKFAVELLVPLRLDVLAVQPDLLARSVATTLHSLVMGSFLQLLCVEKVRQQTSISSLSFLLAC